VKNFVITVIQLVPNVELDLDDYMERPDGQYEYEAKCEYKALDKFHMTIPIACLDHYEITCTEVRR